MHEQIQEKLNPPRCYSRRHLLANAAIAASRGGSLCLVKPRPQFLDFPLELGVFLAQVGNGVAQRGLRLLDFGGGLPLPQDAAGMIETQAGGLRQRCSPSLDRWQVVYHLDQATPIALVDVIEMMMGEPTAKLGIVATADRLLGLGRGHSVLAADQKRGSDCHPIVPRRIALVYVSLPTFLSLLDVRLAVFLLAAREPGLSSFFHIACKIIVGFAMIRHCTLPGRSRLDYPAEE